MKNRTTYKTITWRIIATLTTFLLILIFESDASKAGIIVAIDTVIKTIFYYYHKKSWKFEKIQD